RRRHTRFSRDWSSDVCSSDLWESVLSCAVDQNAENFICVFPLPLIGQPLDGLGLINDDEETIVPCLADDQCDGFDCTVKILLVDFTAYAKFPPHSYGHGLRTAQPCYCRSRQLDISIEARSVVRLNDARDARRSLADGLQANVYLLQYMAMYIFLGAANQVLGATIFR